MQQPSIDLADEFYDEQCFEKSEKRVESRYDKKSRNGDQCCRSNLFPDEVTSKMPLVRPKCSSMPPLDCHASNIEAEDRIKPIDDEVFNDKENFRVPDPPRTPKAQRPVTVGASPSADRRVLRSSPPMSLLLNARRAAAESYGWFLN